MSPDRLLWSCTYLLRLPIKEAFAAPHFTTALALERAMSRGHDRTSRK
jgi:hypothetical protein